MKKTMAVVLASLMLALAAAPAANAAKQQGEGGIAGFLIGCCFGIRSAAAYNDGRDLHWREWIRLIPIAGIFGEIYDGVDGMNGITTAELAARYPGNYY